MTFPAGYWATWGQRVELATGETLSRRELVRASLAVPCVWRVTLWVVGAAPDSATFNVTPGLGFGGGTQLPPRQLLGGTAEQAIDVAARELVVTVDVPVAVAGSSLVVACVAAPLTWPHLPGIDAR